MGFLNILFGKKQKSIKVKYEFNQDRIGIHFLRQPISYYGKQGKPVRGFIFRDLKPNSQIETKQIVNAVIHAYIDIIGTDKGKVSNVSFVSHESILEKKDSSDPFDFFGGNMHFPHFYMLRYARNFLENVFELKTHDVSWVTFSDSFGGKGILYVFYQC